jgi:hypothetical protein
MARYQTFHIPTMVITLSFTEEPEDHEPEDAEEIEVEAEVEVQYSYDEPDPSVGWDGGFCWEGIEEFGVIRIDDEELEGWEYEAAARCIERWMDSNEDDVYEAIGEAAEGLRRDAEEARAEVLYEDRMYYQGRW